MNKFLLSLTSIFILYVIANSAFASSVTINNPLEANSIGELLRAITKAVARIVGAISVIMIIVAGIMYLLSAGNPQKMEAGKKTLIYAIMGLVIAVLAESIVAAIEEILGVK